MIAIVFLNCMGIVIGVGIALLIHEAMKEI